MQRQLHWQEYTVGYKKYVLVNAQYLCSFNNFLTLGNTSKNGPIHKSTNNNRIHEIIDAIWVLPPTVC